MKTIIEHIEYLRGKPHQVRKQIALGVAGGVSLLIALVWLGGNVMAGTFAIKDTSFMASIGQAPSVATTSETGASGLAGAGAAQILEDKRSPIHIEVVETSSSVPTGTEAERTVLPF
jgi:hypothetical protein